MGKIYSSIPSGAAVLVLGDSLSLHLMRWNVIFRSGKLRLMLSRAVGGGGKAQTMRRWFSFSAEPDEMDTSPIAVGFTGGLLLVSEVDVSCDEIWLKRRGEFAVSGIDGVGM